MSGKNWKERRTVVVLMNKHSVIFLITYVKVSPCFFCSRFKVSCMGSVGGLV